jgi:hypothetical protein
MIRDGIMFLFQCQFLWLSVLVHGFVVTETISGCLNGHADHPQLEA